MSPDTTGAPKKIPWYAKNLKEELRGSGLSLLNSSLPVDSRGMVEFHFKQDIEIELYRHKKIPKFNPRNPNPWAERLILNVIREEIPAKIRDPRTLRRIGEMEANWILRGAQARLDRLALSESRVRQDMDVEFIRWDLKETTKTKYILSYLFDLRMIYYGVFIDAGRGPASKRSTYFDRTTKKTQFQAALEEWVSRKLGLDGKEGELVAKAIRQRINQMGYPERPFLRETLREMISRNVVEQAFETEFAKMFEKAVESGIKFAVDNMGGSVSHNVTIVAN